MLVKFVLRMDFWKEQQVMMFYVAVLCAVKVQFVLFFCRQDAFAGQFVSPLQLLPRCFCERACSRCSSNGCFLARPNIDNYKLIYYKKIHIL